MSADWKRVDLCGAAAITRVCGVYELRVLSIPSTKVKIKVVEHAQAFIAFPNVAVRSASGMPDRIGGLGRSEMEALQDAIDRLMWDLSAQAIWEADQLEWSDPCDF